MTPNSVAEIDDRHLKAVLEVRPEAATWLGSPQGDHAWGAPGPEAVAEVAKRARAWSDERAHIDATDLAPRDVTQLQMDQTALEGSLGLLEVRARQLEGGSHDPDVAGPRVAVLLYQAHQLAPASPERMEALASRLATLGPSLAAARAGVGSCDAALLERARGRAASLRAVLVELPGIVTGHLRERQPAAEESLKKAAAQAAASLDEHGAWLDGLKAESGVATLGTERVDEVLQARRFEMTSQQVLEVARIHIEEMRLEMRRLRRRSYRRLEMAEALSQARGQLPYTAEEAAAWLRELCEQARGFCLEQGSFPMTDDALVVEDAPRCVHDLLGPLALLPPSQAGAPAQLLVGDPGSEVGLSRLSVADLESVAAHYASPGAWLRHVLGQREHGPVRLGVPRGVGDPVSDSFGADLSLGWRWHSEEVMREMQFRDSPAARMVMCQRGLLAGLCAWYDIQLARGVVGVDEAAAALVEHGALAKEAARRTVLDLVRAPTVAAGAVVGKARLMQLRRSARIEWRHGYSDRRFHDLVMAAGNLPVAVLFGLLRAFSPFAIDEGTMEYEINERPVALPPGEGQDGLATEDGDAEPAHDEG